MTLDIAPLATWIGKEEVRIEPLSSVPANALAATLDRVDDLYMEGDALPPLWHWLHFLPLAPMSEVGPDGHPKRGGFLPPVPLERRMWAGSRLAFHRPLRLGERVEKRSRITKVEHKAGRTGEMVFVGVEHAYSVGGVLAILEEQDIVYRAAAEAGTAPPPPRPAPEDPDLTRVITPDPVLLFRYSALTFNGHRIHFDAPYAREVEGYPGLVVHGPLVATLLLDNLRRARPEARLRQFEFRALSPLFHTAPFTLCASFPAASEAALWARNAAGGLCFQAHARFE
jgi:3-methylfumaryl-CoA hydratase